MAKRLYLALTLALAPRLGDLALAQNTNQNSGNMSGGNTQTRTRTRAARQEAWVRREDGDAPLPASGFGINVAKL